MVLEVANAGQQFQASLQDFKNAFSLTEKGGFKSSVDRTKGELYVGADSRLCSANIHGGKGTVQSRVTNFALRQSLICAFRNEGASNDFLSRIEKKLLGDCAGATLLRKDVKCLIEEFEDENLMQAQKVGEKAQEQLADGEECLGLDDFRILARGAGFVCGKMETKPDERKGDFLVVDQHNEIVQRKYNEKLRSDLYEAVRKATVPPGCEKAREILLKRLEKTLIRRDDRLSCDEIRQTLRALDEGLSFVPPKSLKGRNICARTVTGGKGRLITLCEQYENQAKVIRQFIDKNRKRLDDNVEPLERLACMKIQLAEIGREALSRKGVSVKQVKAQMDDAFCKFTTAWIHIRRELSDLWRQIQNYEPSVDEEMVKVDGAEYCDIDSFAYNALKPVFDQDLQQWLAVEQWDDKPTARCVGKVLGEVDGSDPRFDNDKLTSHIDRQTKNLPKSGSKDPFCLHYDKRGRLRIPHSSGNITLEKKEDLKKPWVRMAFLADRIKRPIVLLSHDQKLGSLMYFYNRNLQTGKKMTGEPLVLYYSENDENVGAGKLQFITLNRIGREQLARMTISKKDEKCVDDDNANANFFDHALLLV